MASGAQFIFNCYRHWATLVVHDTDGLGHFLHRKEGVTQGDTLEIITYGIGILPITREIRAAHHIVMQTWYDDETGAGGNFADT